MASNDMEVLEPAATVETLTKIKSQRMNRRRFMTAVGVAGAATGAVLASRTKAGPRTVAAAGPSQNDALNFALNLEFLEATFYSYITQGTDLPGALTIGSGAITGNPAKLTFTGSNAAQITDMLNEIYYDELNHVIDLMNLLGTAAVARPAINLAAYASINANNALGIARLFEDVGVTAYAGTLAAGLLTGSNLTYAAQIMSVEAMHAGAIRLVSIQNPAIAPDFPAGAGGATFTASTTAGSPTLANVYYLSTTLVPSVGDIITGPGLSGAGLKVTAITLGTKNAATTGTTTGGSAVITLVASFTNLAVGNIVTGTNIAANTTIKSFDATAGTITMSSNATSKAGTVTAATALTIGIASITLSGNATASVANQNFENGSTNSFDVAPYDPGTAALAAAGPTAAGGFFATAGASTASSLNPAGVAFARTSSQVLYILYGLAGAPPVALNKGGFFVNGVNGVINSV